MTASGTTRGTTVQPATADTGLIGIKQPAGKEACGASQADSFSPGGHINVTMRLHEQANAYHFGCFDTFSIEELTANRAHRAPRVTCMTSCAARMNMHSVNADFSA
jgi:hypothetical protein